MPAAVAIVNPPRGRSVLLGTPEEIAYRHAGDGLGYVHKFDRRDKVFLTPGGKVEIRAPHKLWTTLYGKPYLQNPPKLAPGMRVYAVRDARGAATSYVRAYDRGYAAGLARKLSARWGQRLTVRQLTNKRAIETALRSWPEAEEILQRRSNPGRASVGAKRGRAGTRRPKAARPARGSGDMRGRKHARRNARGQFIKTRGRSNPPKHKASKRSKSRAVAVHRAKAPAKKRRYARTSAVAASRAGRTLRFRRVNPPIIPTITQGALDGVKALGGLVAEGALCNQVEHRLPGADKMGTLTLAGISHVLSASVVSLGAHYIFRRHAAFIAAGAWANAYRDLLERHATTSSLLTKIGFSGYASGYNMGAGRDGFAGYAESGVMTPTQRLLAGGFRAYAPGRAAAGFAGYGHGGVEAASQEAAGGY